LFDISKYCFAHHIHWSSGCYVASWTTPQTVVASDYAFPARAEAASEFRAHDFQSGWKSVKKSPVRVSRQRTKRYETLNGQGQ